MGGVLRWFEERGEIPLRPPYRVREYAPLTDDPDRPFDENFVATIDGVAFAIEHCDSHGWMSTRTIRCLAIDPTHPACISAYCHVRDTIMTFRVDRIITIIGLHSGKMVSSAEHLALLAPYLTDIEQGPDIGALIELQQATRDGVFALLHIAMSDGGLSDEARAVVLNYVNAEAEAVGAAYPPPELIDLWVGNLAPPLDAVRAAVKTLLNDREKFARLLPWLLKVARCPGAVDVPEEALRELFAAVRRHFRWAPRNFPSDLRATR
jgi:hypothetical protein